MLNLETSIASAKCVLATLATALVCSVIVAPSAKAAFSVTTFGGSATDPAGVALRQAGAHPDVTTDINFARTPDGSADGNVKNAQIKLPAGLVGNPLAMPACSAALLASTPSYGSGHCPVNSQVGLVSLRLSFGPGDVIEAGTNFPVFNVVPPSGVAARFAFNFGRAITYMDASILPDTHTIAVTVTRSNQSDAVSGLRVTLWGVPADPVHDALRSALGSPASGGASVSTPRVPLMTSPTSCTGRPLTTTASVNSWEAPDTFSTASFDHDFDGFPIETEGCDVLKFAPSVTVTPTATTPDSPTGLDVDITSPQNLDNPDGLANAQLEDVKVTLPEGMSINPGSAGGLQACSDDQLGLGTDAQPTCPDAAKIGTVSATTPVLEEPLTGGVFIRSQASNDPASGDMFRMALVLESKERGVLIKLPGAIRVDPASGQIVTAFDDNPQLPVERIQLHLKSGPRAPLATQAACGSKTVDVQLSSWAGHDVHRTSAFDVPCTAGLGGFSPSLSSGTALPVGGAFSPFALSINKPDGNTALTGLRMELPEGLLANLKGNVGTQVGTATTFAGPGSNPYPLPGKVFLEGAYGDAPFSLKVVVPAKAGPFDLGEVVVRQKIYVDPIDAHVTVVSDQLPTIVSGVPVRLQRLDVSVDKPGFMINPTSCAQKTISATLGSATGQTAAVTNRFQVGSCSDLGLKPSLGLTLSGKGQTTDGKHPAVSATLTQPGGQAHLKKVRVALPLSLALDPDNAASDDLCSFVAGSKPDPKCPASSVVGKATAVSPILNEPLTGPVYFTKNERKDPKSGRSIKTTPKLVIPLTGENGVKLTLTGESTVVDDRLVTTFDNIPDAQVSSFKLDIIGGKKGILVVSGDKADICKSTQIADQQIDGQNNKQANTDVFILTPSCPLKVLSKKVGKRSVTIKVGGLGAGKVTVTGKGIKKTSKTISRSTVATITAKRTKGKPGKVRVSFDPAGPAKARKTTK